MPAYAELDSLIALQFKAWGYTLRHNQPVHSLLFGRRASHIRGRGLDFEELRSYVSGDDVRSIDWRVTARMRKPYVRTYSEERDRPTMLVVDQRINMFFGSRVSMKAVVAAEVAALAAWRVFQEGDRVGSFVFNDETTAEVKMRRSRANVLMILEQVSRLNQLLRADSPSRPRPARLNEVLASVARICRHNSLILIASDFDGADQVTRDLLLRLSRSNDVICCLAYDPLAINGPSSGHLVISDGELQLELPLRHERVRRRLQNALDKRMQTVLAWQHELDVPVLPLSTAEDVPRQLRHLIGHVAARRKPL